MLTGSLNHCHLKIRAQATPPLAVVTFQTPSAPTKSTLGAHPTVTAHGTRVRMLTTEHVRDKTDSPVISVRQTEPTRSSHLSPPVLTKYSKQPVPLARLASILKLRKVLAATT